MNTRDNQGWRRQAATLVAALVISIGVGMISWNPAREAMKAGAEAALRRPTGQAQLVEIDPLPGAGAEGDMCQWTPAAAGLTLAAALQEQGAGSADPIDKRKPVRMIKDSYSSYSSVAVDLANDEVVMTDESLFNILTYNRTENTPPTATMSEPKRMIGGLATSIEYQCGLYIDPRNGDIYAVNNDTVDKLVIFSRDAKGDVPPNRLIHTPHTTYGVAVDEEHQELFLTEQEGAAVSVFNKMAKDEDPPLRLLQGDKTGLGDPHGIAVDAKRNLMFVANFGNESRHDKSARRSQTGFGISNKPNWPMERESAVPGSGKFTGASITIYPRDAEGDVAPVRVIKGPHTRLNWPTGLAVDPERGELFIANDTGDDVLVFDEAADGDAAPKRVIEGIKSMVKSPTGVFYDPKHDELWVSNFGNHSATVYKATASGDAAPLRVIRSAPASAPTPNIGNAYAPAYDTKRNEILVPD